MSTLLLSIRETFGVGMGLAPMGYSAAFEELQNQPAPNLVFAFLMRPRDPDTQEEVLLAATTGVQLHTEPEDEPPGAFFRAVCLGGFSISRFLTEPGRFVGGRGSTVSATSVRFDNSGGEITDWQDYDWSDAQVSVYVGGVTEPGGTAYPWSLFEQVFEGTADELNPGSDATLELKLLARKQSLDVQLADERYSGFGGALNGTASGDAEIEDVLTWEWFGRLLALSNTDDCSLMYMTTNGWGLLVGPTGDRTLSVRVQGVNYAIGEVPEEYIGTTADTPWLRFCVVAEGNGSIFDFIVYMGVDGRDPEEVGRVEGLSANLEGTPEFGPVDGVGVGINPVIFEARAWQRAFTLDELLAKSSPIVDPLNEADLVECWKFESEEAGVTFGERGVCDLNITGTIIASNEGDDPEAFPGGPLGQTKPEGFGQCRDVPLVPVDTPRGAFQWANGASEDLRRLKIGGAPMIPDVFATIPDTLPQVTFINFAAATKTITLINTQIKHLVPGQAFPPRDGQRVSVTGSSANDGTYTVAVNGTNEDGTEIVVEEALVDEVGGAGSDLTVSTYDPDVQYTYDLSNSTVTIPSPENLDGELTADVIIDTLGEDPLRASQLIAYLLGEEVDTERLLFDPEICFLVASGATMTKRQLIDKIASSALAWWIEGRHGDYRMGTHLPPSGSPIAFVGENRISSIQPLPSVQPFYRLVCNYDHTWKVVDKSGTVASVPAAARDRMAREFQAITRTANQTLRDKYRLSTEREPFETYLVNKADAETFLSYAAPLYMQKWRWFNITAHLGPLVVQEGDAILVQHPDPTYRLTEATLARVAGVGDRFSADGDKLQVFLE